MERCLKGMWLTRRTVTALFICILMLTLTSEALGAEESGSTENVSSAEDVAAVAVAVNEDA